METLLGLVLVGLLMSLIIYNNGTTVMEIPTDEVCLNESMYDVRTVAMSTYLKYDILKIFEDDHRRDKRELIVKRLRELNNYEDPGEFLEKFDFIHDYIFNYYLYDPDHA